MVKIPERLSFHIFDRAEANSRGLVSYSSFTNPVKRYHKKRNKLKFFTIVVHFALNAHFRAIHLYEFHAYITPELFSSIEVRRMPLCLGITRKQLMHLPPFPPPPSHFNRLFFPKENPFHPPPPSPPPLPSITREPSKQKQQHQQRMGWRNKKLYNASSPLPPPPPAGVGNKAVIWKRALERERQSADGNGSQLFLFPDNDMPSDIPRLFDIASPALLPPVLPFCPEFPPPTDDRRSLGFARFRSLSPLSVSPTPCTPDPISGTRIAGE
ncbi:hypothetical protein TNIN_287211 [Trichonephila inaurata madagascariensis]|uniref:Uncharacterized protein n=1 Tax=Trichonephila inaurata madagascariensis TaxID=2747483 RepID=A0A8X7CPS0_9ARAC|nr:hypothetical protein TNIN_287211 [Trichonephila inaurata madagascariensis]